MNEDKPMEPSGETDYNEDIPNYGDVFTVKEFRELCTSHMFVDYDGHGHPARQQKMAREFRVKPSKARQIPNDATHVVWFNK